MFLFIDSGRRFREEALVLMQYLVESESYLRTVRNAHDLAELLKKLRPGVRAEVEQLQRIVTAAHVQLDALSQLSKETAILCEQERREHIPSSRHTGDIAAALNNLQAAYQTLGDLKHGEPLRQDALAMNR